jgi:hypothetical protein
MDQQRLHFHVSDFVATVPDGIDIEWQGKTFPSGPLLFDLDQTVEGRGVLDYAASRARVQFPVIMRFPEFADMLTSIGMDPRLSEPVRGLLTSEGDILEDHSFRLGGESELQTHELFPQDQTSARVLPGL